MTAVQKPGKTRNIALWATQIVLALSLAWSAYIKLFLPSPKLAAIFPWTAQVSVYLLKFTGLIDLLAAAGLIMPALLRIQPKLTPLAALSTPLAALCLIVLMICAAVFHLSRGESSVIGVNIAFAVIAAFVAWGRCKILTVK